MASFCQWILDVSTAFCRRCGALAVPGGDYCALHRFGELRRQRTTKALSSPNRRCRRSLRSRLERQIRERKE